MPKPYQLTEAAMQQLEQRIPLRAEAALRNAYERALTVSGRVLEAKDGLLIETSAEGTQRIIRSIASPTSVTPGTRFRLNLPKNRKNIR